MLRGCGKRLRPPLCSRLRLTWCGAGEASFPASHPTTAHTRLPVSFVLVDQGRPGRTRLSCSQVVSQVAGPMEARQMRWRLLLQSKR